VKDLRNNRTAGRGTREYMRAAFITARDNQVEVGKGLCLSDRAFPHACARLSFQEGSMSGCLLLTVRPSWEVLFTHDKHGVLNYPKIGAPTVTSTVRGEMTLDLNEYLEGLKANNARSDSLKRKRAAIDVEIEKCEAEKKQLHDGLITKIRKHKDRIRN
jgi:uncharacterized protein YdcH (DUF465 family)